MSSKFSHAATALTAARAWRSVPYACAKAEMAALTLDDRGMVCDCNPASEALFKYRRSELIRRHVSMLLPQLAGLELVQNGEPNPRLRFLCRIGQSYQAVTQCGESFAGQLFFNVLDNIGCGRLSLIVRPAGDAQN